MIDKLEMFIALSTEAHFGRAAESLGITQPSLSTGIKQLEEQMGVMLVRRGSRYQGLTPEGQRVLEWARRIVRDTRTMREEMRTVRKGLSGNLRLAVIPTALTMASQLTAGFSARHPNVRFTILSRTSAEILTMLDNLEVDAGLSYLDNEPLGRVSTVPIYAERYSLVVHHQSPLATRKQMAWSELSEVPLCLLTPDMQNRRIINQYLRSAGVTVTTSVETSSTIVLLSHVLTGKWATILPERATEIFLPRGDLATIPLVKPDAAHVVGLIAPYQEPHTPVLTHLLQEARAMADLSTRADGYVT